jgi:hypothetical protein
VPVSTPTNVQQTPLLAITNTPTSIPILDVYEQNIHLFDYDVSSPVLISEESMRQEDGYTVHEISYPSPKTGEVPAYLIAPDGSGLFAGILLMPARARRSSPRGGSRSHWSSGLDDQRSLSPDSG